MSDPRPPTIDPVAAERWNRHAPPLSPWLHEEVARRMEERLQWIVKTPQVWVDWAPLRGGLEGHALVARRYPGAVCHAVEAPGREAALRKALKPAWWRPGAARRLQVGPAPDGAADMLWANMALHTSADPQDLIAQWHRALAPQGFLMFSCLGPDTLRELRALYRDLGWPPAGHEFTDMHDWGDMLVHSGFAEPVMDMERIRLSWETPAKLLAELVTLGANLHPGRFAGLRGRRWRATLESQLQARLAGPDGRPTLSFEVIYGHSFKPEPRPRVQAEAGISLDDMRSMLHSGRRPSS